MSEFGRVLRDFRQQAGLTQEKLAERSGISVEAVKTLEAGRRRHPRPLTVQRLGDGLGLSADERAELAAAGRRTLKTSEVPGQLPDDLQDFTGRAEQVAAVENLFTSREVPPGVVVLSAIAGMGGIGKTALGVHVAHRVADQYPDGQLYLNLRGFGPGEPMSPREALGRLMEALGVRLGDNSDGVDQIAARYRSALAGRRVFVFLDNAASEEQVLPLLPGSSTCAVLITSRRSLTGLPGAAHLALDTLADQEALVLLDQIVGGGRIASAPDAAAAIVRLCGGLPLALRIAGARLAAQPSMSVADLARQFETSRRRLDELALGDLDVRTSIEASLATATERTAVEAFRLLGLYDGEVLDVRVAARLLELPVAEAERCLEQLVDLHLLDSPAPRRYRMHDLVRSYVRETTAEVADDAARAAARLRVLRFYLAMCWRLRTLRYLGKLTSDWYDESWTADADQLTADEILEWLDDEAKEIIAAVGRAASGPAAERATVARIAVGLNPHLVRRRRYSDGAALGRAALAAEEDIGDPFAAVMVPFELSQHYGQLGRRDLAVDALKASLAAPRSAAYAVIRLNGLIFVAEHLYGLGRYDEAAATADRAKTMALELGNEAGEAEARRILGMVAGRYGKPEEQDDGFERGLAVMRRIGDAGEKHWMLYTIGMSYRESGRLEKALATFEECLVLAQSGDDQFALAEAHEELGRTELDRGDPSAAEQHLRAALVTVRGTWLPEARVRRYLGVALSEMGRVDEASAEWRRSLELFTRHGAPEAPELRALLDQV